MCHVPVLQACPLEPTALQKPVPQPVNRPFHCMLALPCRVLQRELAAAARAPSSPTLQSDEHRQNLKRVPESVGAETHRGRTTCQCANDADSCEAISQQQKCAKRRRQDAEARRHRHCPRGSACGMKGAQRARTVESVDAAAVAGRGGGVQLRRVQRHQAARGGRQRHEPAGDVDDAARRRKAGK